LARALIMKPALLLCDEPTGNLDADTGREIIDLLLELRREEALTVFIVTHDAHVIERAEHVLRLKDGSIGT
jgi:predicted ABC-type transport system involved in lysophospholipase L1 biosynthesis ATPase subunit